MESDVQTFLLLIRHGHTEAVGQWLAGWRDVPLDAEGKSQAARLVERLSGVRLDAVYSSPILRTRETADMLAAARGLPLRCMPEFAEFGAGELEGRRFDDLDRTAEWQRFNEQRSLTRLRGGETMLEVQTRMVNGVLQVAEAHRGGVVAVVSHGDPIRAAVMYVAGMPIDFYSRLEIAPASITVVALGARGPKLVKVNDTGDLQGLPNS